IRPMHKSAILSPCLTYRYVLTRAWDEALPLSYWIMLNPSTADASLDDPTIRRCMSFARRWGCGGIDVRNLFALRATEPRRLRGGDHPPFGPDNDKHLIALAERRPGPVVAAWGTHGALFSRGTYVTHLLAERAVPLSCLGTTKDGHPKHPLYVRTDVPLIP